MIVTAIVGSYRKGGVVDRLVDQVLSAAAGSGAEIHKVYLIDQNIRYCTNCRACTQAPGGRGGVCPQDDDLPGILELLAKSDAFILASPMNFWTVTAVMKTFIERLVCLAYWPWGAPAPRLRLNTLSKRALIITSSAAPALLARLTTRLVPLLKATAKILGAKTVGVLAVGLAARAPGQTLTPRTLRRASALGKRLLTCNI